MTKKNIPIVLVILIVLLATLACSLSSLQQNATALKATSQVLRTDISGLVSEGSGLLKTARVLETEHPGILGTVQQIATQGAPLLSTIQAVATNNPGLVQTAQSMIQNKIPTGEPPPDIPILNRAEIKDFIGYSEYIFYVSPSPYQDVMQFYKAKMPDNGWQYQEDGSHEYASASQLIYTKDARTASIDLSTNPLNNTTAVVISLTTH